MGIQGWTTYMKETYARLTAYVAELRKNPNAARIFAMKMVLLSFLIAAATTITIISQRRLEQAEYRLFQSRFNSVSDSAIMSVADSLSRMNLNIRELSVTYGHVFPNATQWPNVAWKGFHPTAGLLSNISSIGGMGILPLVLPDQVQSYQNFISNYYDTDPYCDRSTHLNPTYPNGEIWNFDYPSDYPFQQYPDQFGNTTNSPFHILTPVAQYTFSSIVGPYSVSYNLHGDMAYTRTIDLVINCTTGQNHDFASTSCGTIAPAAAVPFPSAQNPQPRVDDMVAVFLHPIFPADDQSALVGFAAGTFGWKALLTNVIPRDVEDVDCVIEADGRVFTFCIQGGTPYFMGEGSLQESKYSDMRRSSSILDEHITVATGQPYVVNFYPTRKLFLQFETERPERGAMVLFVSFLFCTILFACYDVLQQREFDRNQAVLDTKRRFVRFISHEIRTPLNTVRLGMKLLEVEMAKFVNLLPATATADLAVLIETTLTSWKQLADEIIESSESAVEVLNDLLNYDKIEVGALKLELSYFNVRDLVEKTTAAMQVQAQQKGVALELSSRCPCAAAVLAVHSDEVDLEEGEEDPAEDKTVVGDASRMGQVLRNLISNALKFTPADGQVSLSVTASGTTRSLPDKVRDSSPLYQGVTHVGTLSIAVKDSGAGLSPQQLSEICAEGVQFNANELQAGQGSGLGLFISKGIIEQHGGKLVVTSEGLGKGVTFSIELPLFQFKQLSDSMRSQASRRSHSESIASEKSSALPAVNLRTGSVLPTAQVERAIASAAASATAAVVAGSASTAKGALATVVIPAPTPFMAPDPSPPSRLLVVDDSGLNRKMMIRLLLTKDHVCEQAEDGEVAVRKYLEMVERGEPPDAILMDYEMPVMNGPSATARLRELGCACLILGVTGNVLPQDVAYFTEMGANGVLPKPIVLEDFERILSSNQLRQRLPAHGPSDAAEPTAALSNAEKPQFQATATSLKIHPAEELV